MRRATYTCGQIKYIKYILILLSRPETVYNKTKTGKQTNLETQREEIHKNIKMLREQIKPNLLPCRLLLASHNQNTFVRETTLFQTRLRFLAIHWITFREEESIEISLISRETVISKCWPASMRWWAWLTGLLLNSMFTELQTLNLVHLVSGQRRYPYGTDCWFRCFHVFYLWQ